ncbi:BatD family protein [Myxococcota bacterium]|nr:BatD family protein [Myxococcota bacterium]
MIALACALAPPEARAGDELAVSASLSESHVAVGDTVTLEINIVSHVEGAIEVQIPAVAGLTELSRSKSEGTSIQWSSRGQQITREHTITIELEATKPGKHTIPPIEARAGKVRAASAAVTLDVGGSDPASEGATAANPNVVEPPGPGEQRLFLRYKVDRATAYVGQQILVDLDVYASPNLNFAFEEVPQPPTLDGFWREIVEAPTQRLTRRIESVGGRSWQVYRLWRLALFPLEPGEVTISPAQIVYSVNRSIFGGGQRERRKAPAIKLDVRPLPSEGRPAGFVAGNVGVYDLTASLDRETVPAGKAVVLSIALGGRGNLKNVRLPEVKEIPGFRVFAPTVSDDVKIDPSGVSGTKRAEILLMPEVGGRLEIPPLEVVTFDPEAERYQRLTTPSLRVAVEGDPAAAGVQPSQPTAATTPRDERAATASTQGELRPIRFRSTLEAPPTPPWQSVPFAALMLGPPLVFLAFVGAERVAARAKRETPESKRRAAVRHARHRLEKASEAARTGDAARAYHELSEALLDYASEKTGAGLRGMTNDELRRALEVRGAPATLAQHFAAEHERARYARFGPGSSDARSLESALERTESILEQLEAWTPKEAP